MLKRVVLCAAAFVLAAGAGGAGAQTAARYTTGTPEERAEGLVRQMTVEEKLTLVKGYFGAPFGDFIPPEEARAGSAGYVPGIPRLGIPPQWQADAGIGVATQGGAAIKRGRTALPSGLAVAASWDPEIAYEGGKMIGAEARADGFNVMLAGSVNLVREPRGGRTFEYAGEDPLLAGTIVGAAIDGVQSNHIISTIKHYALNDQETDRNAGDVVIDEAAMRMSDLLAFQLAIERGDPGAVMCAYNKVGGIYACENEFLLDKVLRDDWGFEGYVLSDWGAVHSTAAAAKAGLDQESGYGLQRDDWFGEKLAEAVRSGAVSRKRLDQMATRILTQMIDKGLVDYPFERITESDFAANRAVSLKAAEAGAVLLKNEGGILPLANTVRRIAVIGGYADKGVLSGGGSSQVYPEDAPDGGNAVPGLEPKTWPGPVVYYPSSPLEELRKALPDAEIDFIDGKNAVSAQIFAAEYDMAIVFATQWSSESIDVSLTLPDNQDELIAKVAGANPNTVVVLQTNGPVLMPWDGKVKAILEAWYPGRMGGLAIANLLTGKANPSGHLPVTFPASLDQLPFPGEPRTGEIAYSEGAAVGYKWFDKTYANPAYPFGHGLSYTSFEIGEFRIGFENKEDLVASVQVTNSGARAGAQVIQLYASSQFWEGPRRLVGFRKFHLAPGETASAKIPIDPRLLALYKPDWRGWVIEKGEYVFSAGVSSRGLVANVMLPLKQRYLLYDWKPGDSD